MKRIIHVLFVMLLAGMLASCGKKTKLDKPSTYEKEASTAQVYKAPVSREDQTSLLVSE